MKLLKISTQLSTLMLGLFLSFFSYAYTITIINNTNYSFQTNIYGSCVDIVPSDFLLNKGTLDVKIRPYNPDEAFFEIHSFPQGISAGWEFQGKFTHHPEVWKPPYICTPIRDTKAPWQGYYCYAVPDDSHPTYTITASDAQPESQSITINPV
jgi:hypothetical protein